MKSIEIFPIFEAEKIIGGWNFGAPVTACCV